MSTTDPGTSDQSSPGMGASHPRGTRVADVRALARKPTRASVARLVEIMIHGRPDRVRLEAAIAILDLAWGKPQPMSNVEGHDE
jgi:hypothetical protein